MSVDAARLGVYHTGTSDDYELDLEVGWTAADYDEVNEYLCIYAGTQAAEALMVDVWNGASWTNVIADLTASSWNNVSVSTYLTGSTFEIRFIDGDQANDGAQDTWDIDAVLLHTWTPSYIPAIDQAPTLDNPSDSDNMYAQYLEYQVTVYVSDQNGFADIDYLEIGLWDNTQATEYCRFRYDEDTNTFSEEYDGGTYVSLNTGSSSATESGNDIDATFYFTVDWDFPDATDLDARCYVIDTQTEEAMTWYEVNWDVETRLEYSVAPTIDDASGTADRGNLDGSFSLTGTVIYYNSVDDYPASTAVDVWVSASEYGTTVGPWSDLTLTSGAFDVTGYADDVVGQDTYTVKVVEEGTGAGGTDLYYTTSVTDTYIADRVQVQSYSVVDDRVNIGTSVNVDFTLYYDYDNSPVIGGTVTLNTISALDQGSGVWRITDSEATVTANTYDTVTYSGGTHGISVVDQNGLSQQVIWDQIIVQTTVADDTRVNIGDNVEIRVTLWLAYDSTFLGSGDTVTLDGQAMTWDAGNSWFDLTVLQASVGLWTYFVNSSSEATYGITALDTNSQSVDVVWDQIVVQTTVADDTRVDVGDNVEIRVTLWLVYDSTFLGSGDSVTLAGLAMTWDAGNSWFDLTVSQASVGLWSYFVNSSTETNFGITAIDTNSQSVDVIWDQIVVQTTVADDTRVNVGDNAEVRVTLWLAYDSTFLGSGDSVTLAGQAMTWDAGNSWFDLTVSQVSVGLWGYFVNSSSETGFGITALDTNSQSVDVIWDQIVVQTTVADDARVNVGDNAEIRVTLWLAYDSTFLGSGDSVTLAGQAMTWDAVNSWFDLAVSQASIGLWAYFVNSSSEATYGITSLDTNSQSVDVIWDRIVVQTTVADDTRVNIGNNVEIRVTLRLAYDSTYLGSGDSVILAGQAMTWDAVNSWFDLAVSQASVGLWTYFVNSTSDAAYGITNLDTNGQNVGVVWDQVVVQTTVADDTRVNVGANVEIRVTLWLAYDSTPLGLGDTVILAGLSMSWDSGNSWFDLLVSQASVGLWNYYVNSTSETTYGITSLDLNSQNIDVVWDQIVVQTTTASDTRDNIGDDVQIRVTLLLAYDNTFLGSGDTVILAGQAMVWDATNSRFNLTVSQASVGLWTYFVNSSSDATYGITSLDTNSQSVDVIWDQVTVRGYSVVDDRVNVGDSVDINVTVEYEFDDTPVTDGSIIVNGEWATHIESGIWEFTVSQGVVGQQVYHTVISSGNAHGIIAVDDTPTQPVTWDRIQIRTTTTDNDRINYGSQATIAVTARLEFDLHYLGSGDSLYLNDTLMSWNGTHFILNPQFFQVGIWTFFVNSTGANEATYGISAVFLDNNQVDQIWDRIQILTTVATDSRVDVGTGTTTINVTAQLEYDSHLLTSGDSLYLNGTLMTWDSDHFYTTVGPHVVVDSFNFYVNTSGASETTFGITVINVDGNNADVIWDRLIITIGVDDSTPDNGVQANFTLSVIYDFDDTACATYQIVIQRNTTWWHSFTDGNKSQFVDTNSDVTYTYTVQLVTSESSYNILVFSVNSQQVVWSAIPNSAPTNDADPVLVNPDDGYMYARYKFYIITSNVSDADGYNDIQYVELTLYDNTTTTPIWTVRYTVSGDTFSIILGSTYIDLSLSSFASMAGNDLDITWIIKIDWDHTDMLNMVPHQFVIDSIVSDSDFAVATWDIETRLDYSSVPALSDDRGDVGTSDLTATGDVTYYGSALVPLANETDVWVVHDVSGTWSGDLVAGSFSIANIGSSASVRLNSYTIKIVIEGDGSGGIDLYYTGSVTDTFITDRIEVYQAGVVDGRININVDCEVWWRARYEYDSNEIQSGLTLVLNGSRTLVWNSGDLYWRWQETSASPGFAGFDVVSGSESAYGLTALSVSTAAQRVIWDAVIITMTDPADQRINIGENASGIIVSAVYAYDGTDFDGTFSLNNTNFVYGVAQKQGYTVLSISGDTYGITSISSNDETWCVWDSLTITITDPADQRQNVNANASGIVVTAVYDYDSSSFDGTLTLNNTMFSYATAQKQSYTVDSVSGGTHSITAISTNDETWFIWDSLSISITDPGDQRINVIMNASGIVATAVYDYDGSAFDGTLTLNNTQFSYSTAQRQGYTVDSVGGGTHGITAISVNDETWCIWDSLTITITDPSDQRVDINANASGIVVSAIYDYDGSTFDGVFILNNTQFSYAIAQKQGYTVDSVSGGTHGISAISVNDETWCIWDSLTITITDPSDQRINTNANASGVVVSAVYDYDGSSFDGTLTLNNTQFSYATAQKQGYTVDSVSGGTHGISAINVNDETWCIWDSLTIAIIDPADQHVNINTNASGIVVSAVYDYDGSAYDGILTLNNTQFSYAIAQKQGYTVDSVSGGGYGITAISSNGSHS